MRARRARRRQEMKARWGIGLLVLGAALAGGAVWAQASPDGGQQAGMDLWQIIRSGKEVMIAIALLSVTAVALIFYYFLTLRVGRLVPGAFAEEIAEHLRCSRFSEAELMCRRDMNFLSCVLLPAFSRLGKRREVLEEAVRSAGVREASKLWQRISYLSDIAVIAPMLGLLGTVLGMIQAFNTIVLATDVVKPIYLAAGISKALVTTAAGLIVGIPAIAFYAFFRDRVQRVVVTAEGLTSELVEHFSAKGGRR